MHELRQGIRRLGPRLPAAHRQDEEVARRHGPGQVLRVVATDPGSVCDMAAFAEQTGHALLHSGSEGGKYVFFLKKA